MSAAIGKAMRLYVQAVEKRDKEMAELEAKREELRDAAKDKEWGSPETRAYLDHRGLIDSRSIGLGTSVGIRRTQLLRLIEKELRTDGK